MRKYRIRLLTSTKFKYTHQELHEKQHTEKKTDTSHNRFGEIDANAHPPY